MATAFLITLPLVTLLLITLLLTFFFLTTDFLTMAFLATDFFTIHKLLSTSGISARHEIDFLRITFGVNTTDVVGVTHITN